MLSCGGFKLDSEKNCLNQQSACFKWDKTDPQFVSATPTPNTLRATLPTITLVFSEDLKNGEDKSAYVLSGAGAVGLSIASVKRLTSFTYEIALNGSIIASAPINIDFSALKDYSNNFISGQTSVSYTGNVAVGITASASHNGVSTTGYTDVKVTFQHSYATDPENTWQISVTSGVVYCGAGVAVEASAAGVYLQSGVNQVSSPILVTPLPSTYAPPFGAVPGPTGPLTFRIVVCVKNKNNANVQSLWSWQIIRDDTAPTSSATPVSDSYGTAQNLTITCSDNAETIAVNSISGTSNPGAPGDPTFNVLTGAINPGTGAAYTGAIAVSNFLGNPTYVNYKWRCMDVAGHQDAAVQSRDLVIDTNIPAVNVTLSGGYHAYVSNTAGGYTSTTFSFSSDQVSQPYRIASGATLCSPAGGGTSIIGVGPFTTNASANGPNGPHVVPASTFAVGPTDVRICVRHSILTTTWGTAYAQIIRDDTAPTFTSGLTVLTNPGDGTVTLGWNPAADTSPIESYDICQSTTAGACTGGGFTATYTTNGAATSYQVTGLSTSTTYYFVVRARDMAGNRESNNVEKKSRTTLSVAVTGYSSAVPDFRITQGSSTLSFTGNGTQPFTTVFAPGDPYSVVINNQPGGQNCAFKENQFGNISVDTTLNVACVSGYVVGGNMNVNPGNKLGFRLFQGRNTAVAGNSGTPGSANGTGAAATFSFPEYLVHLNGSLYVSDTNNFRIRRITVPGNVVTNITGTGVTGVGTSADDAACGTAAIGQPMGITTDGTNLYLAEYNLGRIRKISDVTGTCQVTTLAGTGTLGYNDGSGNVAQFNSPRQIVTNGYHIFVADTGNNRIRRISLSTGIVDTLAGNGTASDVAGTGAGASFSAPHAMALVGTTLYVATTAYHIMSIDINSGNVSIVAGSGAPGNLDASGLAARLNSIYAMTTDGVDLYVAEYSNHLIRRIEVSRNYAVTTIAGASGLAGDLTGVIGGNARFNVPHGLASDGRSLYVANHTAHTIRRISDAGAVGYWPLGVSARDYASDVTTAFNATPQNGPTQAVGRFGETAGAYNLNGTNQYFSASASNLSQGTNPSTMCAWIKLAALPAPAAQPMVIVGHGGALSNGMRGLGLRNNAGTHVIQFRGRSSDLEFPFTMPVGTWNHICGTFQHVSTGTQWASVFVNGHLVGRADTPTDWNTDPNGLVIGGLLLSGDIYFNGQIAEVRVYSRVLNESEINELAQDAAQGLSGASFNSGAIGLLSHYNFDPLAGAPTLTDAGALGYTMALGGVAPAAANGKGGDSAGAYVYSGGAYLNSAVTANALPSGAHPRTMCAWVNLANYPALGTWMSVVGYGPNTAFQQSGLAVYNPSGNTVVNFESESGERVVGTNKIPLNTWSHICVTFDSSLTARVYLNGVLEGTSTMASTSTATSTSLYIGVDPVSLLAPFSGKIDDVRIYNNALSAAQIRQFGVQIPDSLVTRFDMVDAPSGTITDISGWSNNGTGSGITQVPDHSQLPNQAYRFINQRLTGTSVATDAIDKVTMSAWIRLTGSTGANQIVVINGNSGASGYTLHLDSSENIRLLCGGVGSASPSPPYKIPQNVWTHVAAVKNGTWTLLVNGAPLSMGSDCTPAVPSSNAGNVYIGANQINTEFFRGDIDDVHIYAKALTTSDVRAIVGHHPMQVSSWSSTIASSSMKLHYNPDSLSMLNDGDPASLWEDLSGSLMHLTQGTPADYPVYSATGINGRPAIGFDTNRHFTRSCNANLNSSATTLIGVMNQSDTSGGFRGIFHHGDKLLYFNGGSNQNLSYFQTGVDQVRAISQNAYINLLVVNPNMIFATAHTGATGAVYKNGSNVTTSSASMAPAFSCSTNLTFGKPNWPGDVFNGKIGDFMYFNQSLSTSDRALVECYLSAKYGVPLAGVACP